MYNIDAQSDWLFSTLLVLLYILFWNCKSFRSYRQCPSWNHRCGCVCCWCVKSCQGLTETQLQEEEQRCSHMLRGSSKHMPAHTHPHTHNHRAAVVMRWPRVFKNTDMHQEADILFSWCPALFQRWQLKSACLSVRFRRKPSRAHTHAQHACVCRNSTGHTSQQLVTVYNQYLWRVLTFFLNIKLKD